MYSAITLRRRIEKLSAENNMRLTYHLKNIRVNGVFQGCSGHIVDSSTGTCIYVNNEAFGYQPLAGKAMYRLARDEKDFSSNSMRNGYNRWCKEESLPHCIVNLMKDERRKRNDEIPCGA